MDYSLNKALKWRQSDPDEIINNQDQLLQYHFQQASRSTYYQELFRKLALDPAEITLADLDQVPLTPRQALEENPGAFTAVSEEAQVDIALTSGTTGSPVPVPYTVSDLTRLAFNEELCFRGAGLKASDRILLCVTLDKNFIAGLAYYSGAVRLGASVIRSGPGQPARQWEIIKQLRPNVIVGVPSFLLNLGQWGRKAGLKPEQAGIKSLITIGEPIRQPDYSFTPLGRQLSDIWQARLFSSYGATELETACCECAAGKGGHIHPELMIAEIIDDQGNKLPAGEPGELVITTMGVEGFPLIRFKTGDIATIEDAPCECGWKTSRLGPLQGRLAQRLKYKGTTLYPEMIYYLLQDIEGIKAYYLEIRSSFDLSDDITVVVGVDDHSLPADRIADLLQAGLRVRPPVEIKETEEVLAAMNQGSGSKTKRFFDYR